MPSPAAHQQLVQARRALVRRRVRRVSTALSLLLGASASHAAAQDATIASLHARHVLQGNVRAADESRLVGARIELLAVAGRLLSPQTATITNHEGVFRFEDVDDGIARMAIRRLGFRPETLSVEMPQVDGGAIVVLLERVAQPLAPVLVREARVNGALPNAFERRRSSGFGHFITRADIEKQNPQRTMDLLRSVPGLTVGGSDGSRSVRFRSTGGRSGCDVSFFLNGVPVASLDLDALSPRGIESVEIYSGAATVPAALRSALAPGGCGAIAIWSRMGDAPIEYADEDDGFGADSLARRVATGWAYTADQVEMPASPLPGMGPVPGYPDGLRKAGVSGRVVAEFVVDEQGRVDPGSVGIVSSTNAELAAAVRASVSRARFSPAYTKGHVVRQVVQLPVVFEPPGAGLPR